MELLELLAELVYLRQVPDLKMPERDWGHKVLKPQIHELATIFSMVKVSQNSVWLSFSWEGNCLLSDLAVPHTGLIHLPAMYSELCHL